MNTQNDNASPKGLPLRTGMRRLINPVVYRHLRAALSRLRERSTASSQSA
jgi:hypothetical protein